MRRSADHAQMRVDLMAAAVHVIAQYGMEGVTSKKIAAASKLNEAYIFRYFTDLVDLRAKSFFAVDKDCFAQLNLFLEKYPESGKTFREKVLEFMDGYYKQYPDIYRFIIRYAFSAEFELEAKKIHVEGCADLLRKNGIPEEEMTAGEFSLFVVEEIVKKLMKRGASRFS